MFEIDHWEETERYTEVGGGEQAAFLIINLLIISLGLLGNGAVLLGSTRYRALKMDRISLIFVHNIAIADIAIIILRYIPTTITLIAKQWVFGKAGCFLLGVSSNVPSCAEILTIVLLSFHRLMVLKQTPSQRLFNFEQKLRVYRVLVVVSWVLVVCLWLTTACVGFEVLPGPRGTTCVIGYAFYENTHRSVVVTGIMLTLGLLAPLAIIFSINSYIMWVITKSSTRSNSDIPTRVLATLPLICLVYFGSYICTLCYAAYLNFSSSDTITSPNFYIVVHYVESISVLANPVIYCARREFRLFVARLATFKLDLYSFQSVKSSDEEKLTPNGRGSASASTAQNGKPKDDNGDTKDTKVNYSEITEFVTNGRH